MLLLIWMYRRGKMLMTRIEKSIEVDAPVHECFHQWSNIMGFPRFMLWIEEVLPTDKDNVSFWRVKTPEGTKVDVYVELDAVQPDTLISWRTLGNNIIGFAQTVYFQEVDYHTTRILAVMDYQAEMKNDHEFVIHLFDDPDKVVERDLAQFNRLMMKQPAAVKSQAGLSASGSIQGADIESPEYPGPEG